MTCEKRVFLRKPMNLCAELGGDSYLKSSKNEVRATVSYSILPHCGKLKLPSQTFWSKRVQVREVRL